jgi:hypothetical protein
MVRRARVACLPAAARSFGKLSNLRLGSLLDGRVRAFHSEATELAREAGCLAYVGAHGASRGPSAERDQVCPSQGPHVRTLQFQSEADHCC